MSGLGNVQLGNLVAVISESTPPGSVRTTVPSGVNSWRRLCPVKDAPPDDDDDDDDDDDESQNRCINIEQ